MYSKICSNLTATIHDGIMYYVKKYENLYISGMKPNFL